MRALTFAAVAVAVLIGLALYFLHPASAPSSAPSPTRDQQRGPAATPPGAANRRSAPVNVAPAPPAARTAGQVIVRGEWGSRPGQFGRRREQESNPEAPMAIAAGGRGEFAVIDQINRRVQR